MEIYTPNQVWPDYITSQLSEDGKVQVRGCYVIHTDTGTVFYTHHHDHIMIVVILGSGTKAMLYLKKYHAMCLPIYFLGHTSHVIEWGKKYCEEVGTLFRLKEFGHG